MIKENVNMKTKKWIVRGYDAEVSKRLMEEMGIPSLAAKLFSARGFENADEARSFAEKNLSDLNDPFLLCDMDRAVERIKKAVRDGEKIAVYGDYDADGVTATYIVLHYLKSLGADCVYHIPDRLEEGYGVAEPTLSELSAKGVSLIITVDTGITAAKEVEFARDLGMDVIITDHHNCPEELPRAYCIINPRRADCSYPFPELAGVGVAFKLVCALSGGDSEIMKRYVPYVCIGTVADVMPLVSENRIIVSEGLLGISARESVGISALLEAAGSSKEGVLSAGAVGFLIGPRINAAGRMGSAELALRLLFAEDEDEAKALAEELCEKNRERQQCESEIFKEALAVLEENPEYKKMSALVIDGEGWHHGVLGIVAARICARFDKPVILISREDVCKGSGRSVPGVSLHSAIGKCSDLLEKFGGHDLAAGISIKKENIEEFRRRLDVALSEDMKEYSPTVEVDFVVDADELTLPQLHALSVFEPFGKQNEEPRLRMDNCKVTRMAAIGANRHLKLTLERGARLQAVFFGHNESEVPFREGDYVDAVFAPEINNYKGESVQLHIRDIRPCESSLIKLEEAEAALSALRRGEASEDMFVSYKELGFIWRAMTRADFAKDAPLLALVFELRRRSVRTTEKKLLSALQIFGEVGLISWEYSGMRVRFSIVDTDTKVNLEDSETYNILSRYGRR